MKEQIANKGIKVNNHDFKDLYDMVNVVRKRKGLETLGGMAMSIELFYHYRGLEMDAVSKQCIKIAERSLDMRASRSKAGLKAEIQQVKKTEMIAAPLSEERFS